MALLDRTTASLPATWYCDLAQYARELDAVWYRDWICVGRADELREAGDYVVVSFGDQSLILTRDREGRAHAFHNTCRHRGSRLCIEPRGRFANGRIVCPYHAWSYSLGGELLTTPRMELPSDFRREDYPLYAAHLDSWGGFLFVNLSDTPASDLASFLGDEAEQVRRWPLADLVLAHREVSTLACNWKVFWENYSECYHCPGIHPELCRIMPLYREGLQSYTDSRTGAPHGDATDSRARVGPGLTTWTLDGQSKLPLIEGPSEADRALGVVFASFTASFFIVAHPDYVRTVRISPRGPEQVELTVDWLLPPGVAERHAGELEKMVELGRLVVAQDGRVCELNQQGLRSRRHRQGVLMPQEEPLHEFHEWLRRRLAAAV
jgi:Rieske 2Fe-2S family protein